MEPIGPGARGAAVEDVQRRLRDLGHDVADADGEFGPETERAVRVFQQGRRLVADGVVGPDTWQALVDAGFALGDRLLYATRPLLRGDDVLELQRALGRLGFDTGLADGIHGAATDTALRDFQHNIGIVVDGIAGVTTLAQLESLRRRHQAVTSFEVVERHDPSAGRGSAIGLRVLLDPAGGPDARGHVVDDVGEAEIVWDVTRRLEGRLAALGAHPVLSRGPIDTPSGSARAALANALEVDAVVSLACGSLAQRAASGVAAYYFGDEAVRSDRGRLLAERCVDGISTRTGARNCHAHPSTATVLRETRSPAAIVELGFATNEAEGARLREPRYRHELAAALAEAVVGWATGSGRPD